MNIYGLTIEEMEEYFLSLGSKAFHAKQLFSWLYEKRIEDYKYITDIKKDLVEVISKDLYISEVMNNNYKHLAQNGGNYYDWIELYNNSKETALNYYLKFVEKDANNEVFIIPKYSF